MVSETTLRNLHIGAALTHGSSAAAIAYLVSQKGGSSRWPLMNLRTANYLPNNELAEGWVDSTVNCKLSQYNLSPLLPVFPALSAINHTWAVLDKDGYSRTLKSGVNAVRWSEYAVSSGIMLWLLGSIAGVKEVRTLVQLLILNAGLQYMGYMIECAKSRGANAKELRGLLGVAWALHLSIWLQLFVQFYSIVDEVKDIIAEDSDSEVEAIPPIVYTVIPMMFGLYSSFGIVLTLWAEDKIKDYKTVEASFLGLSLTSKLFLTWSVWGGVVNRPEESFGVEESE